MSYPSPVVLKLWSIVPLPRLLPPSLLSPSPPPSSTRPRSYDDSMRTTGQGPLPLPTARRRATIRELTPRKSRLLVTRRLKTRRSLRSSSLRARRATGRGRTRYAIAALGRVSLADVASLLGYDDLGQRSSNPRRQLVRFRHSYIPGHSANLVVVALLLSSIRASNLHRHRIQHTRTRKSKNIVKGRPQNSIKNIKKYKTQKTSSDYLFSVIYSRSLYSRFPFPFLPSLSYQVASTKTQLLFGRPFLPHPLVPPTLVATSRIPTSSDTDVVD